MKQWYDRKKAVGWVDALVTQQPHSKEIAFFSPKTILYPLLQPQLVEV